MKGRTLRVTAGMVGCILGLVTLLFALNIGQIRAIPGTALVEQIALCDAVDCATSTSEALPYFSPIRLDATTETRHLRATLQQATQPKTGHALYLPKFADSVTLRLNGQLIYENSLNYRLWSTPLLVPLPDAMLQSDTLVIDIALSGPASEGLDLQPFYYGAADLLAPHHAWRSFLGPGLARFSMGLMIVLAAALLVVWGFRRKEMEYLWLGLACASATITLIHFGYGVSLGGYRLWTLLWIMEVSLYVLLILKFLRRFLGLSLVWPEHVHTVVLALFCAGVLLLPPGLTFAAVTWGNVFITVPSALTVLVILWINRGLLNPLDLRVFFGCLCIAAVLGIYALYMLIAPTPVRTMHLFHLMPLVMSLACLWLILSRLIHSLRSYEALTATLNDTVAQKSAELEASFAELADIKRREAIAEERDRIMLDLHDGIGGQLVSTLAYMQSNEVGDEKVRRALEDALRDLALMLDSMENHDSLVTLLGMLRTRLEGLLSEHGIEFDWQVHGEPELANSGPSQSLHLARIVQEAITNVIKHANADTITIFVDETQIRISDNGRGFDLAEQTGREHPSNGIANMRRRCASIGAKFNAISGASGTHISLQLK